MNKIEALSAKFKNIDAKLNSNVNIESITSNFQTDCERILDKFNYSFQKKYSDCLNTCRNEMIHRLTNKRDVNLKDIDDLFEKMVQNKSVKAIELRYTMFASSLISLNDSILNSIKFKKRSDMLKSIKYFSLTPSRKTFSLANLFNVYPISFFKEKHRISNNSLFLAFNTRTDKLIETHMLVINQNGDVAHSKKIKSQKYDEYNEISIKANKTNVILLYTADSLVEIQNFKLELVHSFKLDSVHYSFSVNNYDIGVFSQLDAKLTIYNYETVRTKRKSMCLSKIVFYFYSDMDDFATLGVSKLRLALLGLNDRFIFVEHERNKYVSLHVYDRKNFRHLFRVVSGSCRPMWFIHEAEIYFFLKVNDEHVRVYAEGLNQFEELGQVEVEKNFRDVCDFYIDRMRCQLDDNYVYIRDLF